MNKRLTIICIAFAIAYIFIIGQNIVSIYVPAFMSGFKGSNEPVQQGAFSPSAFLLTNVQPKQGTFTTPTSITNLKTGKNIEAGVLQMVIKVRDAEPLPMKLKIAFVIETILSFIGVGFIIYIPVQSFKVVRSIVKNEIFDIYNIKRIRRIGYTLLVICAISIFSLYVMSAKANYLVELENYKFVADIGCPKMVMLILGLVVLAFAEILKMALRIKEENDLTV